MRTVIAIFAIIAIAGLVANTQRQKPDNTVPPSQATRLSQFNFPDGTRCVVMDGYQRGGLACDWTLTTDKVEM